MLFLAVSNLMVSFIQINKEVQQNMVINDEKEMVYMTIKNYLDEAEKVINYDNTNADKPVIVLLNKPESSLLPFTIITTKDSGKTYDDNANTPIYNLSIKNVAYTTDGIDWGFSDTLPPRTISISGKNYTLDYWKNQVYIGTPPSPDTYCTSAPSVNCILVGYKQNSLAFGTTAFAPFIKITKPTDLTQCGSDLCILSPYEKIEYKIMLSNYTITTTNTTAGESMGLPYFYISGQPTYLLDDIGTLISTYANKILTLGSAPRDIISDFGITDIKFTKNAYLLKGTGTITVSGTVVTGYETQFEQEVYPQDIIMVSGRERKVAVRNSQTSLVIDSNLDILEKTPFYISKSNYVLDQMNFTVINPQYDSMGQSKTDPTDTTKQSNIFLLKLFSK